MSIWTDHPEMDAYLRAEQAKGISYSVIAKALSKDFAVKLTRCAAIGRARRIGIPQLAPERAAFLRGHGHINARPKPKVTKPMGRPKIVRPELAHAPPEADVPIILPDERTPTARVWETRKHGECAFPFREGDETYSCCAKTGFKLDGKREAYCAAHKRVMYQTQAEAKAARKAAREARALAAMDGSANQSRQAA